MKYLYFLFFLILIYSCGDDPLSPEEQAYQDLLNDPRPKVLMTMSDELELTLKIQKFKETVSYMTLQIIFNPDALEVTSYSKGEFGDPWSNMDFMDVNNDSVYCSFVFTSDISGSGDLLNLEFDGISSSSYENSTIYIASIILEDANGDEIEFSDDNHLYIQDICYINGHESGGERTDYGSYVWSNKFCWPLNYVP